MRLGVVGLVIHPDHDGDILALRRRGDHDLFGPGRQVLSRPVTITEYPGRFEHQIDSEILPGEPPRIALGQHLDCLPVDHERVTRELDGPFKATVNRVVGQEVSQGGGIGEIVDGHELEVLILLLGGSTKNVPTDAAEAVDSDFDGHRFSLM